LRSTQWDDVTPDFQCQLTKALFLNTFSASANQGPIFNDWL